MNDGASLGPPAGVRTLAVCCDQWPVVASGRPAHQPVAVLHANRVVAVGPVAAAEGVRVGLRRREAQARCPSVEVVDHDPEADARAFEAVAVALDEVAPRWEVAEAGRCAVPARGPSRIHGGDVALADAVAAVVRRALAALPGGGAAGVGVAVADGPRAAAVLAEQAAASGEGCVVVPPGATPRHLAGLAVGRLSAGGDAWGDPVGRAELVDLLRRLGLRNLGRFAALEATDVLARFGPLGRDAHDFARGAERTLLDLGEVPVELRVSAALDPPADRVDRAAFTAKVLADELHAELGTRGLACTRVLVVAETELGDRIERSWRHEGALGASAIAQRVRWQIEGWLVNGRTLGRCRGGVSRIELVPEQVVPDDGRQLGFWGGGSEAAQRAMRALARVEALVGADGVVVPEWRGGRAPLERYRPVPLAAVDLAARAAPDARPWPGALPAPSPVLVWPSPVRVELVDEAGRRVGVSGRGSLSAAPARCELAAGAAATAWAEVTAWAGPWCVEERWWDPVAHRRRARIQVVVDRQGSTEAHLLTLESGSWWLEATYD